MMHTNKKKTHACWTCLVAECSNPKPKLKAPPRIHKQQNSPFTATPVHIQSVLPICTVEHLVNTDSEDITKHTQHPSQLGRIATCMADFLVSFLGKLMQAHVRTHAHTHEHTNQHSMFISAMKQCTQMFCQTAIDSFSYTEQMPHTGQIYYVF
jgi:hypothetical protein